MAPHLAIFLPYNTDMIPDWQLPPGVDRGLWDYLHSAEMVAEYDAQMAVSSLARIDVDFCLKRFDRPGPLIDLGCGTGRLARHVVPLGYDYHGVDLSEEMLAAARAATPAATFVRASIVDLEPIPDARFQWAACLFNTLGMIRGARHRQATLRAACRVLRPGGELALHVHNRWFHGLRGRGLRSGEITMPQAYGGAALTLYHYTRREIIGELRAAGFEIDVVEPVGLGTDGRVKRKWFVPGLRTYGYLIAARKPRVTAR